MAVLSNLSVDQGADFSAEIIVQDSSGTVANLTGYTGAGQIRKTYSSTTATNFVVTIVSVTQGVLSIALSNSVTNGMKAGRYVYDVEITKTSNGEKTRVVEGQITINPGVTQ
jgi:hypothetical protein|tara:strand:- start:84 stop:419 length:336 start_codon:yes stop_codon:yes gene_type:complete